MHELAGQRRICRTSVISDWASVVRFLDKTRYFAEKASQPTPLVVLFSDRNADSPKLRLAGRTNTPGGLFLKKSNDLLSRNNVQRGLDSTCLTTHAIEQSAQLCGVPRCVHFGDTGAIKITEKILGPSSGLENES